MSTKIRLLSLSRLPAVALTLLAASFVPGPAAHAAITVLRHYKMGESDPGAAPGGVATSSVNSIGGDDLTFVGAPLYSSSVAASSTNSTLSLSFSGTNYGHATFTNDLTDNFGVEMWIKPDRIAQTQYIFYSGNPGSSGWGILQSGAKIAVLFGGIITLEPYQITATNKWIHLALVRASGETTLYVDDRTYASFMNSPNPPGPDFVVGAFPLNNEQNFTGEMDDIRVFTFAPGAFQYSDLLNHPTLVSDISIEIIQQGENVTLQWPTNTRYGLQITTNLAAPDWKWTPADNRNGTYPLTNCLYVGSVPCFFRLAPDPPPSFPPDADFTLESTGLPVTTSQVRATLNLRFINQRVLSHVLNYPESRVNFHWTVISSQSPDYTCRGITGYLTPNLSLGTNSLYSGDVDLQVELTRQATLDSSIIVLKAKVTQTQLTIPLYTTCQGEQDTNGPCPFENALPTTEPN